MSRPPSQAVIEAESMRMCGRPVGTRPEWMSEYQYRPCRCLRPEGHSGGCECTHTRSTDQEAARG